MKEDEIKISMSNGALKYEITIKNWAINCNTKNWLLEQIKEYLEELIAGNAEKWISLSCDRNFNI